ncbi:hypothetical protein Tco_0289546 [Tanacetum coccineum]
MPLLYLPKSDSYVHFIHPLEDVKQSSNPTASQTLSVMSAKTTRSCSISAGAFTTLDVSLRVANILSLTLDWIRHTNHSSKSRKPLLVMRPTHTSDSSQLGKYFPILHCLTLVTLAYNFSFLIVQTILAFPRVLDDMETSRLGVAKTKELSLRGTQLVIVVVIDKSSGNISIKSRTMEISLNFSSSTLAFIKDFPLPLVRSS